MAMQEVTFKITGISPLLQHNPSAMRRPEGGVTMKKIPTPEDEAEAGAYRLPNGDLFIQSQSFRSSIIGRGGGASGRKIGKFTANSRVAAGLFMLDEKCPLVDAKKGKPIRDYEIHTCRAIIQKNGILRSRPKIDDWACLLRVEIDADFLTAEMVLELLNISGRVSGVGDFRPSCKGVYGRYKAEIMS